MPSYAPLLFSKFQLLREVAQHNPFDSEYFFWMDAGACMRGGGGGGGVIGSCSNE